MKLYVLFIVNMYLYLVIHRYFFNIFRSRATKLSEAEIEALNTENKAWSVLVILNVLHSLVDKSNIKRQLEVIKMFINAQQMQNKILTI